MELDAIMEWQERGGLMRCIQEARILLVDDNHKLLSLLKEELNSAGFYALWTADSVTAVRALLQQHSPELIVLDINLPDGDGFSLFQEIRASMDIPVLFLSARDADSDRLFGLGLGADDYLTKPFLTQELLLRIQLILRRFYRNELQNDAMHALTLGERRVDLDDTVVKWKGSTVPLTAIERTLLRKLAENRGHIVTYDALSAAVWGSHSYGYENSLNVHIRHLREKLEDNPSKPQWLVTARGLGYRLNREVKE